MNDSVLDILIYLLENYMDAADQPPQPDRESLTEELERGDPVARLDPRDVRRRAAREGELPLAQPGGLTGRAEALADRSGIVYMS